MTTDNSGSETTTDVSIAALKTVARTQQELNGILGEVDGEVNSRVVNAIEELENILIDEAPAAFAACDDEPCVATDGGVVTDGGDGFDVPMKEEPTEREREWAADVWGADRVPEEGPVPDPRPLFKPETEVRLPEWVLHVVGRHLRHSDDPDRGDVRGWIYDYVAVNEQFRTPDGRDAITVLLEEHGDE